MMSTKRLFFEKDQHTFDNGEIDNKKTVINSLDYDALAEIIMRLPIADRIDMEKVCVKWKEACQRAWYDVKKYQCKSSIGRSYDNHVLTQPYLKEILLRCGKYLKELSLSDFCDSNIMLFLGVHCKNLTSLECKFSPKSLNSNADDFVRAFTQLDRLKCIRITEIHDNFRDGTFDVFEIMHSLPEEINEIHIISEFPEQRRKLQKKQISTTFEKYKNLQKLTLRGCSTIDRKSLQELADKTSLVYLNIPLYVISGEFFLFDKLVNLEYIDLSPDLHSTCSYIKNFCLSINNLNGIFRTCKKLKYLDLPRGLDDIARISGNQWINLQNLEYLGFSCYEMTNLANTIVKNFKNLKHLKMYHPCGRIDDNILNKLTELEYLETLILPPLNQLSKKSIITISKNCKKLKNLEIPCCDIKFLNSNDDEPLSFRSAFDELSKLQYLEHLNLHCVTNLEDSTIIAIADNCKNLRTLNIKYCTAITGTALVRLANLKNLQNLYVFGLNNTGRAILKFNGLKELSYSVTEELTGADIHQLIKNNPDLERLSIMGKCNDDYIIAADQATKNRTSGIILHLNTDPSCPLIWPKMESQWLKVHYIYDEFTPILFNYLYLSPVPY